MSMELLAPAGDAGALRAAVQSGADAVYLGGNEFGARHGAKNFSIGEMRQWIDYCHLYGVKVHVAVNTLIKEKEITELCEYVKLLGEECVDAVLVQDLGAAEIIKKILPDMPLHASTQMTVTSLDGVNYLERMGFSRVVLARELCKEEIEYICRNTNLETEVFVHGAICMCYSGQCLMSGVLGGRSGNRGRCAQPCRLPYELIENGRRVSGGYLLSPKDMALINELRSLKEAGVTSLKIEGRLKRAEYVSTVVGIYRKYIDMADDMNARKASDEDMKILRDAFSRSGFTDGYFNNSLGARMMSVESPSNNSGNKFTPDAVKRASENADIRKIPVHIIGNLRENEPLDVTIYDDEGNYGYAAGHMKAESAEHKPLDAKLLKERLMKLGGTPYRCEDIIVTSDSGITIPVKEINAVRRGAAESLSNERIYREKGRIVDISFAAADRGKAEETELAVEVYTKDQFTQAVKKGIKRIYAPPSVIDGNTDAADAAEKGIIVASKASEIFCGEVIRTDHVLVSSPAAVSRYEGKALYGDFRLNVYNSHTANHFSCLESVTLSPELNLHEIRELLENTGVNTEVIAYGHLPLMIMRNCPVKAAGKCQEGKNIYRLRDRKNEEFPLICAKNCNMLLLNSKPVYMADKLNDLTQLKINSIRLIFTVENFLQCGKIIDEYKCALKGEKVINAMEGNSFTRGHFYRGVY